MKKANKTFYVSTEGDGELLYLDKLQQLINNGDYHYTVKFVKKKTKPTSFVKSNFNGYKEFPYFHICDYEGNTDENIKKFTHIMDDVKEARIIKKCKYNLCYTNFCFELWLILHKTRYRKSYANKQNYKDDINTLYDCNFNSWDDVKKEDNVKSILNSITMPDVINAISYAKELESFNSKNWHLQEYKGTKYYKENPSLNLHAFIEFVLKKCDVI